MQKDGAYIDLEQENDQLKARLLITQKDNDALSAQNIDLASQNHALAQSLKQIDAEYQTLLQSYEEKRKYIIKLEGKLAVIEAEHIKLEQRAAEAFAQNEHLQGLMKLYNIHEFGSSSEKASPQRPAEQLQLFNDVEYISSTPVPDAHPIPKPQDQGGSSSKSASKQGKPKTHVMDTTHLPRTRVDHDLSDEEKVCEVCGDDLQKLSEDIKEETIYVKGYHAVIEHHLFKYVCAACSKENQTDPTHPVNIKRATMPNLPIPGSSAGASTIAHIIVSKYNLSLPLNRMEAETEQDGFGISKQTMANWLINVYKCYFKRYYARLKAHLLEEDIIHADETRVQVLHEPDRKPSQISWMWLFMSGACSDHQIACFEYNEHRSASVVQGFLEGYSGYITSDGYIPYFKLGAQVKNTACLSHIRRKFIEVMQIAGGEDAARRAGCVSVVAFDKINEILNIDGCFKDLSPGERYIKRQHYLKPKMEEFESWANRQYFCAQKGSRLSKAFAYAIKYWPYLKHVLDDGRLELTNNRAERTVRKFAVGRSNFLFSNTPAGAATSAALYSILISAKLSGLRPFEFFTWLLSELPNTKHLDDPLVLDRFMPWSKDIPDNCFMDPEEAKKEAEREDELVEGFSYEALADALNED